MKKAITLITIIFTVAIARAQYVSIPDTSFGGWLDQYGFSSCMTGNSNTGWRMDTTCNAVVNATYLNLVNVQNLQYLQGIQFFKNAHTLILNNDNFLTSLPALPPALDSFICINNGLLTSIPLLPPTLTFLNCSGNGQVNKIPNFPAPLTYINCSQNNLDSLPPIPAGVVYLDCGRNTPLTTIPALPAVLTYLDCGDDNINSLPTLLGRPIDTLICGGNNISELPTLPNSLIYLYCMGDRNLTRLSVLPPALTYLDCAEVPLGSNGIPPLPSSLTTLICFGDRLSGLPDLPAALTYLDCDDNVLISIPPLPDSLSWFDCSFNADLSCLPHLNAIVHFNFINTAITCVPDEPTSNTYTNPTVPVCTSGGICINAINQVPESYFTVYPNPASNHVMVENSEAIKQVKLYNTMGQTVYSIIGNGSMQMSMDVSLLPTGIYIIEAYSANGINTAKIMVGN